MFSITDRGILLQVQSGRHQRTIENKRGRAEKRSGNLEVQNKKRMGKKKKRKKEYNRLP